MNNSNEFSVSVNSVSEIGIAPTDGTACGINLKSTGYRLRHPSTGFEVLGHARSSRYQQQRATAPAIDQPSMRVVVTSVMSVFFFFPK